MDVFTGVSGVEGCVVRMAEPVGVAVLGMEACRHHTGAKTRHQVVPGALSTAFLIQPD